MYDNFNPRLRERGDSKEGRVKCYNFISIHASAREATDADGKLTEQVADFNPRLREGGDPLGKGSPA